MDDTEAVALLSAYRACGDIELRNRVVEAHRWLAEARARRLRSHTEPFDDLVQVASLGVLNAAERFDATRGVMFRTFASVTADGELRRHYRTLWRLHVPRSVQELSLDLDRAREQLTATGGAHPTIDDVAHHLRRTVADIELAMIARHSLRPDSLEQRIDEYGDRSTPVGQDSPIDILLDRIVIGASIDELQPRERRILELRFAHGLNQREIAREVGVSQVHVSRLLSRALRQLEHALETDLMTPAVA